ncbi:hypothetical protein NL676_020911 [Syzygium grande]|nr:hypothetical protein NL676_020911 [Syzygium grande]
MSGCQSGDGVPPERNAKDSFDSVDVDNWEKAVHKAGELSGWVYNNRVITKVTDGKHVCFGSNEFQTEAELMGPEDEAQDGSLMIGIWAMGAVMMSRLVKQMTTYYQKTRGNMT